MMRLLVDEFGAYSNTKDMHGRTAAESGNVDALKFLVNESGVKVDVEDVEGLTPLHRAIVSGNINV